MKYFSLILSTIIILSACSNSNDTADNDDPDGDGKVSTNDCAPQDASKWQLLPYQSVDLDDDGIRVNSVGELCTNGELPPGYFSTMSAAAQLDCDDNDTNIWQSLDLYTDNDADGVGIAPAESMCVGELPIAGFSTQGTDCNDTNAAVWTDTLYLSVDTDLDGRAINSSGQLCTNGNLPAGYISTALDGGIDPDCNDSDANIWQNTALYMDADGDGIGAGDIAVNCIGNSIPPGNSVQGTDCDDANVNVWETLLYNSVDADTDGVKFANAGSLCTNGNLPAGYFTDILQAESSDCNDADSSIWRNAILYSDNDLDSVGTGNPSLPTCIGDSPASGFSVTSTDCNDNNSEIWELVNYQSIDGDGDLHRVSVVGQVCTDGNLPPRYSQMPLGGENPDCDDGNPNIWALIFYQSRDNDQDGIKIPVSGSFCTSGTLPSGYFTSSIGSTAPDCDDNNIAVWRGVDLYQDNDQDGVGAGTTTPSCIGASLPANESLLGHDCDDIDPSLWRTAMIYQDNDGDGVGSGVGALTCIGQSPLIGTSFFGYDPVDNLSDPGSAQIFNSDTLQHIYYIGQTE